MSLISSMACAGGVGLGATRMVYPSDSKQIALSVTNTDTNNVHLIQSWIETDKQVVTDDFVITPPLFVIKKKSENTLRLVYAGGALPTDRETLFWVNVKAIPSRTKPSTSDGQSALQLAIVSRIKLFYRPSELAQGVSQAPSKVRFERLGNQLSINNPTPYFINFSKMAIGGHALDNTMVAPFAEAQLNIPAGANGELTYSFVNDYGALIKVK